MDRPKIQAIILIGFMGSGKSTVAACLSRLIGWEWIEMDDLVCQKTSSRNMRELFAKGGELLLRETEITIAQEYASQQNVVVSTGGGVVLNKIILDYFKQTGGKVIFLHARFEQIWQRLREDDTRPLLAYARELYEARLPLYTRYADEIIDVTSRSAHEISLHIKHWAAV